MACCKTDITETDEPVVSETQDITSSRIIFVIGGPGSGKGTQCERIVKRYGFVHLSSGDLLRDEVQKNSSRAKQIKAIMDKGDLVPLDIVLDLLKEAMTSKVGKTGGFLLDGFPRQLEQGKRFEKDVAPVASVLYFEASDETMKGRILTRGLTSGRSDDNEETVRKRIENFHKFNRPIVNYYSNVHKLYTIVADGDVEEIFSQVIEFFDKQCCA